VKIGESLAMSSTVQRRATIKSEKMIPRIGKRQFVEFSEFLKGFVSDLNADAEAGAVLLVEGARDSRAMRDIGYTGPLIMTSSINGRASKVVLNKARMVVIMTDLDSEGRKLAGRYRRVLRHQGLETDMTFRKRLVVASRGVFLHVENLRRFGPTTFGEHDIATQTI
jgi:5S rRNA maturation endonuclease (ribonuclease M5)